MTTKNTHVHRLLAFIIGYRTYICVLGGLATLGLHTMGYLSEGQATLLYGAFGFSGVAALRAAVENVKKDMITAIEPAVAAAVAPAVVAAVETKEAVESAAIVAEIRAETAEETAAKAVKLQEETKEILTQPKSSQ